jgi:cyclic peptide transporter
MLFAYKYHTMERKIIFYIILLMIGFAPHYLYAGPGDLDSRIKDLIGDSDIPGLSLIVINNGEVTIRHFGFSDLKGEIPVTDSTLFELGSTSKAFTALALLKLANEKKLNLDQLVTEIIPWFSMKYQGKRVPITLRQLLFHTSGIPAHTISSIPSGSQSNALEQTVKSLLGINLASVPGQRYEYATVNYDVLGLVIERITGTSFEQYLENVIFKDLGLTHTYVGREHPEVLKHISKGYKIGFFEPREYDAPVYKGNNPAGYIITRADDMARWLQIQMGVIHSGYDSLIVASHQRDESVVPVDLSSYAYGWFTSLRGDGEISHSGLNPNFTSHVAFRKHKGIGVAVLANSNSPYTSVIAGSVMKTLLGEEVSSYINFRDDSDKDFSILSILLSIFLLCLFSFLGFIVYRIFKKERKFKAISFKQFLNIVAVLACLTPMLYGLYILPKAYANFSWESIIVWAPASFLIFITLCLVALSSTFIVYTVSTLFPDHNEYLRTAPKIILLSVLSGLSNAVVILLITSSINNPIEYKYLLYYFGLAATVYLLCRKIVQTSMIYLTRNIVYNLRMKMMDKIFSTSNENFERMDRGRIYSIMNYDIGVLGEAAYTFITIITSIITSIGVFFYMGTLSFWATLIIISLIAVITMVYNFVSSRTNVLFEEARETHSVYMRLLNGLIDGFKQLSIHRNKKLAYKKEVSEVTDEYRVKISTASVKFVNAFIIGESLLLVILAIVAFAVPKAFIGIDSAIIMSFIILLLYLIGPINSILNSIPQLMQFKISWNKIQEFIRDIPASIDLTKIALTSNSLPVRSTVDSIAINSLSYQYPEKDGQHAFSVGPIDLAAQKGEVIFIIGGNGSGKTTLSKLLTGLYTPHDGEILINGKRIEPADVGEYFSTVFHPLHLFQRLYDVNLDNNSQEWREYLNVLQLQDKVDIQDNKFTTIDLSGGQRKRLALLECYLENKPILLFDEWAADQDPEYRKVFYKELLPKMKEMGKIVFAITHDDHYFDVADKIFKLEMGKVEYVREKESVLETL